MYKIRKFLEDLYSNVLVINEDDVPFDINDRDVQSYKLGFRNGYKYGKNELARKVVTMIKEIND